MNWKGFDKVAVEIDGADLPQAFKDAMRDAEKAYQSNRRALSLLDYHNDAVRGEKELLGLVSGIEKWMTRVEDF